MTIHVSPSSYEQQLIAAHKARQARFAAAAPKDAAEPDAAPASDPRPAIVVLYRDKNPKDAHVRTWEAWKAEQGMTCKAYLKRRCTEMGIEYRDIMRSCRLADLVECRDLLMWEIKYIVKPKISYPELGRLFGGREHSSVYYSVMKVRAKLGDPVAIAKVERKNAQALERYRRSKARAI